MKNLIVFIGLFLFLMNHGFGQSLSFKTYMNPVIPGDHPDPTLTKMGNDFYTTGSSFNPTPKIYHSTDLVHWEVIAQPVSASWSPYGDTPAGGIWGGHLVFYNNSYWDFFGRPGQMYFVKARIRRVHGVRPLPYTHRQVFLVLDRIILFLSMITTNGIYW
jgi:xylan 1,4-beta-xylosidase